MCFYLERNPAPPQSQTTMNAAIFNNRNYYERKQPIQKLRNRKCSYF